MENINICYCINKKMIVPTHVSLWTVLSNSNPKNKLRIYIVNEGLSSKDKDMLRRTLKSTKGEFELFFKEFDTHIFNPLNSFHGDKMCYTRFYLSKILNNINKVLYLDADTLILSDIAELYNQKLGSSAIGAVPFSKLKNALEHSLYSSLGFNLEYRKFNSGVLLMNLNKFCQNNYVDRLMSVSSKYPILDEPALNIVFYKKYKKLPKKFNQRFSVAKKRVEENNLSGIVHFIGSPKPWDLFGSWIHPNSHLFYNYLDNTAIDKMLPFYKIRVTNLYRTINIANSYFKAIVNKFQTIK